MNILYEVTTGAIGESYERAYVWADSKETAMRLFGERFEAGNPAIRALFAADAEPFCTDLSDCTFASPSGETP
jgi:hypothetical protein